MHTWKKLLGAVLLVAALAAPATAADPAPSEMAAQLKKLSDELAALRRQVDDLRKDLKTEEVRASKAESDLIDLKGRLEALQAQQAFYPPSRKAVGEEIRRTQVELDSLDRLQEKQRAAVVSAAADADEEVRDMRSQIRKARADLDDYRYRGYDLGLPTPTAARRTIAALQPRLERRVKQIEENLRSGAEIPETLRQARVDLLDKLTRLRKLYDGLPTEEEKPRSR
jgi:chromosome segregation ATPase